MLTPRGYTDISQIQNYLLHTIEDYFRPQVSDWIARIEKYIERETGRVFIADEVASEKTYDGNGGLNLFIDECIEIENLTIDGTAVDVDDYLLYPADGTPKTRIKLKSDSGLVFTEDEQNVVVEAKWGYSEGCPDDIGFATTVLVAGIINFSGEMEGEIKSESIGSYKVAYKEQTSWQDLERAKEIIRNYRKVVVG
jgi:hypothetical protein